MFEDLKLDAKLIGAGIFLAVVLIVVGVMYFQHRTIDNLKKGDVVKDTTIKLQQGAASDAAATINNQQAIDKNTDQGNQAINQSKDTNAAKQAAVEQKTAGAVAEVKKKYAAQPKTPENVTAEDKEVARAQINGLWETYCNTTDRVEDCATQPSSSGGKQ